MRLGPIVALGLAAGLFASVKYMQARRRQDHKGLACTDCGKWGHGYMLKDDVWAQASPDPWILLCPRCVEQRIGRRLTIRDFTRYPINEPLRFAYLLGGRDGLGGGQ